MTVNNTHAAIQRWTKNSAGYVLGTCIQNSIQMLSTQPLTFRHSLLIALKCHQDDSVTLEGRNCERHSAMSRTQSLNLKTITPHQLQFRFGAKKQLKVKQRWYFRPGCWPGASAFVMSRASQGNCDLHLAAREPVRKFGAWRCDAQHSFLGLQRDATWASIRLARKQKPSLQWEHQWVFPSGFSKKINGCTYKIKEVLE